MSHIIGSESRTPKAPEAALIIPAYNEASRLNGDPFRRALEGYMGQLDAAFNSSENVRKVVVDDGSIDDTALIAEALGYEIARHKVNKGKGAAIKTGVRYLLDDLEGADLKGMSVAFTDADGSYAPNTIMELIRLTKDDASIAVARRAGGYNSSRIREIAHVAVKHFINKVAPTGVRDPQAGAMAFTGQAVDLWANTSLDHYAAPTEVLFKARKLGLNIVELDTVVTDVEGSHVTIKDGIRLLQDCIQIRFL